MADSLNKLKIQSIYQIPIYAYDEFTIKLP